MTDTVEKRFCSAECAIAAAYAISIQVDAFGRMADDFFNSIDPNRTISFAMSETMSLPNFWIVLGRFHFACKRN